MVRTGTSIEGVLVQICLKLSLLTMHNARARARHIMH